MPNNQQFIFNSIFRVFSIFPYLLLQSTPRSPLPFESSLPFFLESFLRSLYRFPCHFLSGLHELALSFFSAFCFAPRFSYCNLYGRNCKQAYSLYLKAYCGINGWNSLSGFWLFGLVVIVPLIKEMFGLAVGETALAGSILLGIIALPTVITIAEDAIRSTPYALKEASLGMGATHWQTLVRVIIPASFSGISAAVILGVGRAIGETMAVLMVTGNAAVLPHTFLSPVRTLPATIAAELGEAPVGGTHYRALILLS